MTDDQTEKHEPYYADISRSLLQSKNSIGLHCCRPLAYVTVGRLKAYSFYCANDLLRRNLLRKQFDSLLLFSVYAANAVACYQRWQRNSTAVNMTSV